MWFKRVRVAQHHTIKLVEYAMQPEYLNGDHFINDIDEEIFGPALDSEPPQWVTDLFDEPSPVSPFSTALTEGSDVSPEISMPSEPMASVSIVVKARNIEILPKVQQTSDTSHSMIIDNGKKRFWTPRYTTHNHTTRSDAGVKRSAPNNRVGRKGGLRCTECRKRNSKVIPLCAKITDV